MNWSSVRTWEQATKRLEEYAGARQEELTQKQLDKGAGLIKSYVVETQVEGINISNGLYEIENLLRGINWSYKPFDDAPVFIATQNGEFAGYIELISNRYFVIHTLQKSSEIDKEIKNLIKSSAKLDSVWLAGDFLNILWKLLIENYLRQKYVSFKFQHHSKFEEISWDDLEVDEEDSNLLDDTNDTTTMPLESKASTLSITSSVEKVSQFLPDLQRILSDFKAIKMLRYPSSRYRGGYDFWDWGKVTYRSTSFREGLQYLTDVVSFYESATEIIEQRVWYEVEKTRISESNGQGHINISGTPVTFNFPEPLELSTFNNFVETTFERGHGPFRLWGDPIRITDRKVHVYGIDLHLWQQVYIELTPTRFIMILPTQTCGNTVHRMVSNLQRYVAADVQTYVGETPYNELIRQVIMKEI